jgi:hypothetical protein
MKGIVALDEKMFQGDPDALEKALRWCNFRWYQNIHMHGPNWRREWRTVRPVEAVALLYITNNDPISMLIFREYVPPLFAKLLIPPAPPRRTRAIRIK